MLEKYLLSNDGFYNINIMLNNYCNNRCTYCRQFSEYGGKELDVATFKRNYLFFVEGIAKERRIVLFEGGEPTYSSYLAEIFNIVRQLNEKVVILSNGRVPQKNFQTIVQNLNSGIIDYIGLHVPVGDEPLKDIWKKEAEEFLSQLPPTFFKKIIIIGLLHSENVPLKDIVSLLQYRKNFGELIMGNSFCFPHPNIMGRHYINYNARLNIMENLVKVFLFMLKKDYPLILDSTLPCILKYGIEYNKLAKTQIAQYFMDNRVGMVKNFEFHIDLEGGITLLSNITQTCFITGYNINNYKNFSELCIDMNKKIQIDYEKNFKKFPSQCTSCDYFMKGCTGDHFKLISNYAST